MAIILVLVVALIGGFMYYINVYKPNQVMDEAANLIERGKYSEAEVLLASVSSSARKSGLLTSITLNEAKEALATGDYALAETMLSTVPTESITTEIRYELNTQKAQTFLTKGNYIDAEALYAELEQTEEVVNIRKNLFYESRALQCALRIKDTLLNPDSIVLSEIAIFDQEFKQDSASSTEEVEIRLPYEPMILIHYRAKTRGGSTSDGFVEFNWNESSQSYTMGTSVDNLDNNADPPSYLSKTEQALYWMARASIIFDLTSYHYSLLDEQQLARLNTAVQNSDTTSVSFIQYNDVIPEPTPMIIQITPTPEPASTPNP